MHLKTRKLSALVKVIATVHVEILWKILDALLLKYLSIYIEGAPITLFFKKKLKLKGEA